MAGNPPPDVARDLRPFLSWAHQRRLRGPLAIPRRTRSEPPPGLPDDHRWQHLSACLTGSTLSAAGFPRRRRD